MSKAASDAGVLISEGLRSGAIAIGRHGSDEMRLESEDFEQRVVP